jgi:hypothetical protein
MWSTFMNLDIGGKVIMIVLYVIGVCLVILWARFITKRGRGGVLIRLFYRVFATFSEQEMENPENSSSTPHIGKKIQKYIKQAIVWQQGLGNLCNAIRNSGLRRIPDNERNNQKPHISLVHYTEDSIKERQCQSTKSRTF